MFLSEGRLSGAVTCISQCSRRLLPIETRVRSKAKSRGIFGGQSGTGTGVSPSAAVLLYFFIISPVLILSFNLPPTLYCISNWQRREVKRLKDETIKER